MVDDAELHDLMEQISAKYDVEVVPLRVGQKNLKVLQLLDFEQHIEQLVESGPEGAIELPFWAKLWEATFLLALFMGRQPVVMGQRILEIGAGLGVVGIYSSLCGHDMTLSDNHDDALLFARANALLNGCSKVKVQKVDWRHPQLPHAYDIIVGSEVIYDRASYPSLVEFLRKALSPTGVVFLSKNEQLPTPTFFAELAQHFKFKQTVQTLSTDGDPMRIALYAIRHKAA
ncbi:MAG TPA: methyltransferase [Syntrophobacteraceae bacterium]|nr:methyltransferase [Syntrophobacteraceae bacterium]HBD07513.1 methyltransferase [Syntrophobacteraceae bacterium]HBZ53977.1 methyltransferase [Syntrophobacteraceae bacterium]